MKLKKLKKPFYIFLIIEDGEIPKIVTDVHEMEWLTRHTSRGVTCWINMGFDNDGNWGLTHYKGYKICGGGFYFNLFDGKYSKDICEKEYLKQYLEKAIWWSFCEMPNFVKDWGVTLPTLEEHIKSIRDEYGKCLLTESKLLKHEIDRNSRIFPHWLELKNNI